METATKTEKRRRRNVANNFTSMEKAQAILAVWTERCRPAEVCREMGVQWITFNHWQNRALEGMMQALENRANLSSGGCLSPRLQALLSKRQSGSMNAPKLDDRLARIQELKSALPEKGSRKAESEK